MTIFKDGPANGQTLMLKRAPIFLRVVEDGGKFDALDQPDDTPKPQEKIFAYQMQGEPGMVHINVGKGRGGFYPFAEYAFIPAQPTDAELRSTALWHSWCIAHDPR